MKSVGVTHSIITVPGLLVVHVKPVGAPGAAKGAACVLLSCLNSFARCAVIIYILSLYSVAFTATVQSLAKLRLFILNSLLVNPKGA